MKNIGLLIGNGFTISITNEMKYFYLNSSNFFDWKVQTPNCLNHLFTDDLPHLKPYIEQFSKIENNFERVNAIINEIKIKNNTNALVELKHYLAIAFSYFQLNFNKFYSSDSSWVRWLKKYGLDITLCISFNYDLVFETIIKDLKIPYTYIISNDLNSTSHLKVHKPHGSINYEVSKSAINIGDRLSYPLKIYCEHNNMPLRILKNSELYTPRLEADIVLPTQYSTQLDFQWVSPGYNYISCKGFDFTHFIFVGLSYDKCDQMEINFIINHLNPETNVTYINPTPSEELIIKLKSHFKNFTLLKYEPIDLE